MISGILLITLFSCLPQGDEQPLRIGKDATPGVETVDEKVAREGKLISAAVLEFVQSKNSGLKPYLSEDGRVRIYSDFRSKEAKGVFKRVSGMLEQVDAALGIPGEDPEPLFGFLIADLEIYHHLCDLIGAAGPGQADFMERSKNSTGFTIFAPEITTYFHDMRVQQEARADHSMGHNLVHLELHRRYGILPLWVSESLATACEDMAFGEVYAPWNLNGFVFTASHSGWRGKSTRKIIQKLTGLQTLFEYSADPYRDDLAHLGFAFGVYTMLEEPEGLGKFLTALQQRYQTTRDRGGRPQFGGDQVREMFDASFEAEFLDRFQKWWKKPPRWNAKPKKRRN